MEHRSMDMMEKSKLGEGRKGDVWTEACEMRA